MTPQYTQGGSIVGTRHDLSSGSTPEICVFCHTPHNANLDLNGPLWNRFVTTQTFILYDSATLDTNPSQPSPVSKLCQSCHDGVNATSVAHGYNGSNKHDLVNPPVGDMPDTTSWPNCERCHTDIYLGRAPKWLGTDLTDDHPISIEYPTPSVDPNFNIPPDLQDGWTDDVRLVNGKIECITCHDVHNPDFAPFLVKSNAGSALCTTCHK